MQNIVSCSFGKDSLAMLLKILSLKGNNFEVVFYDTGMEFKAIYNLRDKIVKLLEEKNIKYTELKPSCPFLYTMFEKPVNVGKPNEHKGYSWCGGQCRWGTTEKLKSLEKYCKGNYELVGIAYDEKERLQKERKGNKGFPLADFYMTEQDCLNYCYKNGYDWLEKTNSIYEVPEYIDLYQILKRVSCWNCGNKNLKELKNYYIYFTNSYWKMFKELQSKTSRPFKSNYTIFDLEERFKKEVKQEAIFKLKEL
jgi:3'-phosphoadenosine 5'-phosphosulfate sulfotransferase (PAPS reductase)/FAD synthetase